MLFSLFLGGNSLVLLDDSLALVGDNLIEHRDLGERVDNIVIVDSLLINNKQEPRTRQLLAVFVVESDLALISAYNIRGLRCKFVYDGIVLNGTRIEKSESVRLLRRKSCRTSFSDDIWLTPIGKADTKPSRRIIKRGRHGHLSLMELNVKGKSGI